MKTTYSLRSLSLFAILSVLGATAHAAPDYQPQQLAEDGSQRTLEQAEKSRELREQKFAEGGSQRTLEQAEKSRERREMKVAEGGSDRLLAWHAERAA